MKSLEEVVQILRRHKQELQQLYGVEEIAVFGSFARGTQTAQSDVDILVRLSKPIGFRFFELWDYLAELLGMNVDLLTPNALKQKPFLWESVMEDLVHV